MKVAIIKVITCIFFKEADSHFKKYILTAFQTNYALFRAMRGDLYYGLQLEILYCAV